MWGCMRCVSVGTAWRPGSPGRTVVVSAGRAGPNGFVQIPAGLPAVPRG